jgi:hypothetical protein
MINNKYPIKKRFKVNGIEFYIDTNCGMGKGGNYSVYCITDQKNLVTRARIENCFKKIDERINEK